MNLSLKRGIASALICALMGLNGCESDDYARLYNAQPKAPSMDWEAIEGLDHLGPTVVDLGTNFGAWSERAERIELLLLGLFLCEGSRFVFYPKRRLGGLLSCQ